MAKRVQELIDQRAGVWDKMKEIMERSETAGEMSGEDRSSYDAAEADLDRLGDQIELQQRHEARAAINDTIDRSGVVPPAGSEARGRQDGDEVPVEEKYARAFNAFLRHGAAEMEPDERRILREGHVDARALGVGTPSAGGYTVPPEFRNRIIEQLKTFGGMLNVAEIITTDTGATLSWPTNDDTANKGAILAENTAVSEQDVVLGTANIDAYKYTTKMVRLSVELLQDSAFDIEGWLSGKLAERLGRILNEHFTTGTGTAQPDGLVTGTPTGKTGAAGQVTTVTYDDLIDLIDSLDPAYQGNARFMMSQSARKSVRKLKDSQGRPLWEPSIQAGAPDVLLGYGYVVNQDMPAPAASAKSILFGDFRQAYLIRQVRDLTMLRLNERYADFYQAAFLGFLRADGTIQNSSAVRAYVHPAA